MTGLILSALMLAALADPGVQAGQSAQQLFEAGQYEEALHAVAEQREREETGPEVAFLAGHILLRMSQDDNARLEFDRLAESEDQTWKAVGESARALVGSDSERALDLATKAVAAGAGQFQAHYQLGLARAQRDDWTGAATAFERAADLAPTFAYAQYYAGLANSRIKRVDRTAVYFERFLKLAPKAPERAAVESIVRTLRGK